MDSTWKIRLLGTLQMEQGGRTITRFRTRKIGVLLAYLAFDVERSNPREALIEMLWPECTLDAGRDRLSVALSSLRHQMEPPGVPAGAVLITDRYNIQLNAASVSTDVAAFEADLEAAQKAASPAKRAQWLQAAVTAYRGRLLPGYYENWVLTEQQRLTERFLQAVHALSDHFEQTGDLRSARDYARQAIQADPLLEDSHRLAMRLALAAGDPDAALRQFQQLERLLDQELAEKPSQATRELLQQIKRPTEPGKTPAPASSLSGEASAPVSSAPAPSPAPPPFPNLPPAGTVTFLLTDIEGSTALFERAAEAFKSALSYHHSLLRSEFRRYGGYEFKEMGDAFLVAFLSAGDAFSCAISAQKALEAQRWPAEVGALHVRMALHTGDAEPEEEGDYHGLVLHRAQRILSAGHGGQILCSEATAALVRRDLEPGTRLRDLGLYRLRDVPTPERLFQVEYPQMPQRDLPPLKAESGHAANLPLQFTRFFGREEELARLEQLLRPGEEAGNGVSGQPPSAPSTGRDIRLVTLIGPGGTGKTRLAIEAAGRLREVFRDAVWFVSLGELSDVRLIGDLLRDTLRLPRIADVDPLDQAAEALSKQPSLLVLDNLEHLVEAGAEIVRTLLERAPALRILVTSRQKLDLSGEQEFALPPLPTPGGPESPVHLGRYASVQLFVDRAQAVRPDFQVTPANAQSVAQLCDRLEGIPLALELAAARAQVLTPAQMLARLEEKRFEFLAGHRRDTSPRHRTLRAAIDWSYRLLTPELQRFFAWLSVFRGGWTLAAAEALTQEDENELTQSSSCCLDPSLDVLDYLSQLRECSLVVVENDMPDISEVRFRMLETLREYAAEQLTAEEHAVLTRRHAEYYRTMAEQAETELQGQDQQRWLGVLTAARENLSAALEWQISRGEADAAARMSVALADYWEMRGLFSEARRAFRRCLDRQDEIHDSRPRARLLAAAGWFAHLQADYDEANALQQAGLALCHELGDAEGEAQVLNNLAVTAQTQGRLAEARAWYEQSLEIACRLGDEARQAARRSNLGLLAIREGHYEEARGYLEEARSSYERTNNLAGTAACLCNLGDLALRQRRLEEAETLDLQAMHLFRQLDDRQGIAYALANLAEAALYQGRLDLVEVRVAEALAICGELGMRWLVPPLLEIRARSQAASGEPRQGLLALATAAALRGALHAPRSAEEQKDLEHLESDLRATVDDAEVYAIRLRAASLSLEEIVAGTANPY